MPVLLSRRRLLAGSLDIGGLDYLAGFVAPAVALIRNDGRDLSVGELLAKSRHGGSRFAVEYDIHMRRCRTLHYLRSVQSGETALDALAISLVAGHTVGGVDLFAPRPQVGKFPLLVGIIL